MVGPELGRGVPQRIVLACEKLLAGKPLCPLCSTTSVDGAIPWIVTTSSWYAERPDNVCKTMTILRCLRRWTALQKTKKQRQFVLQHKATCEVCARVLSGRVSRGSPFQLDFLKIVLPCSKFALLLPVWPSAEFMKSSAGNWISDISTGEMAGRSFGWQTLKHDGRRKNINVQNSPISTEVSMGPPGTQKKRRGVNR